MKKQVNNGLFLKCPCLPIQVDLQFILLISFINDSEVCFYSKKTAT